MTGSPIRTLPSLQPTWTRRADVVVVGSGAAGMSAAVEASELGRRVLLLTKGKLGGGSTPLAQGGLAAVLDPDDSVALHAADTLVAGAGLCDPGAVETLVAAAPDEIARLEMLGARWDPGPLGLEGGHSRHRIVHAGGDASGAELHRVLRHALVRSDVKILSHTVAVDALLDDDGHVGGLVVARLGTGGRLICGEIRAQAVVLASGGYGQAFATTTNPAGNTGDGLALAVRAGAEVTDVEFVQFHPTVLWQPGGRGRRPLVTEALRGAGAVVVDHRGERVMAGVHPREDLAPRDVVAAAMHRRMTTGDGPATHLWLDARGVGRAELEAHFPNVTAACRAAGIDPVTEPIPVAPGAHYACGGVRADMVGQTTVGGLYAVGEVAATGVHGANRLASNSLTEAVATGRRLGQLLGDLPGRGAAGGVGGGGGGGAGLGGGWTLRRGLRRPPAGRGVDPAGQDALADAMSLHAGVVRHGEGLEHLLDLLDASGGGQAAGGLDLATLEATNLHTVSTLVATAALARTESRGCHRRSDAPETRPEWEHHLGLTAGAGGGLEVRAIPEGAGLVGRPGVAQGSQGSHAQRSSGAAAARA